MVAAFTDGTSIQVTDDDLIFSIWNSLSGDLTEIELDLVNGYDECDPEILMAVWFANPSKQLLSHTNGNVQTASTVVWLMNYVIPNNTVDPVKMDSFMGIGEQLRLSSSRKPILDTNHAHWLIATFGYALPQHKLVDYQLANEYYTNVFLVDKNIKKQHELALKLWGVTFDVDWGRCTGYE